MARPAPVEVWLVDLGLAAKIRPCLILSDYPAPDELALIVVVPHTTALRGNRWEFTMPKPILQPGAFPSPASAAGVTATLRAAAWQLERNGIYATGRAPRRVAASGFFPTDLSTMGQPFFPHCAEFPKGFAVQFA